MNSKTTIMINEHDLILPTTEAERVFGSNHENITERYHYQILCNIDYETAYELLQFLRNCTREECYHEKELTNLVQKLKQTDPKGPSALLVFMDKYFPEACQEHCLIDFLISEINRDEEVEGTNLVVEKYILGDEEDFILQVDDRECLTISYSHQSQHYTFGTDIVAFNFQNNNIHFDDSDFVVPPPSPYVLFNMVSQLVQRYTRSSQPSKYLEKPAFFISKPRMILILASIFKKISSVVGNDKRWVEAFGLFQLYTNAPWSCYGKEWKTWILTIISKSFLKHLSTLVIMTTGLYNVTIMGEEEQEIDKSEDSNKRISTSESSQPAKSRKIASHSDTSQ
ncbi:hypothetical protein C9374_004078 [Naegleria lovaniensis]|uniref:Uncharacterized protein n=1 Tax=Naegleria lovaniensis TaxID=51637 RepID=A0AA88GS92_NAELO|nr:uncharacterized protein C9374_004078 [Naegleria lovaniensis]KAG2383407.1 hypothetical protein C9374_004078 [Naegleria lovaniensis]